MAGKAPTVRINYPYYITVASAYTIKDELKRLGFRYSDGEWALGLLMLFIKPEIVGELEKLGVDGVEHLKKKIEEDNYINAVLRTVADYVKKELPVVPLDAYFVFSRNEIELRLPRVDKETYRMLKQKLSYDPITFTWSLRLPFDWRKVAKRYA